MVCQLDVRGLQISMDDPALVSVLDRLADLLGDEQRFVEGNRSGLYAIASVGPSTSSITRACTWLESSNP
jgi:hypothetical protein